MARPNQDTQDDEQLALFAELAGLNANLPNPPVERSFKDGLMAAIYESSPDLRTTVVLCTGDPTVDSMLPCIPADSALWTPTHNTGTIEPEANLAPNSASAGDLFLPPLPLPPPPEPPTSTLHAALYASFAPSPCSLQLPQADGTIVIVFSIVAVVTFGATVVLLSFRWVFWVQGRDTGAPSKNKPRLQAILNAKEPENEVVEVMDDTVQGTALEEIDDITYLVEAQHLRGKVRCIHPQRLHHKLMEHMC